jgi:tRNA A-37 threonylcarbamoyl transferase component Bud32
MPKFDTLAPGREPIAAYQHVLEIGRGGMGTVNLARAVGAGGFERLVVVKRLNPELLDQPDAIGRFMDEARHAALIHHSNVVGIHQIGRDDDGYFLVLDYVEGTSLDGLVDRAARLQERIPPPIVLRIGLDALGGLHAAHSVEDARGNPLGLLHRDVSLQNVLIGRDGVARLADFGIAKSRVTSVVTDHRYMVGKLLYSPPEYLWRRPVGPTLDVYALGITLWIAFAGTDPWPEMEDAQLMAQILNDRVPRLSDIGIRIAPKVDALVAKACDPDPAERFQTAQEMANAIESIGRETGWLASHGEVAVYLETLLGAELRQRRERIAFLMDQMHERAPVHESVAPPPEPTVRLERLDSTESHDEDATRPRLVVASAETAAMPLLERPRRNVIAVGVTAAALAAAGVWAWTRSGPAPRAYEPLLKVPSAEVRTTAPPVVTETPTPPLTGEAPTTTVEQRASETKKAADRLKAVRPIDPSALPRVTGVVSRPPPASTTERVMSAPKPAAPEPAPEVKPRDGISKTNPYR